MYLGMFWPGQKNQLKDHVMYVKIKVVYGSMYIATIKKGAAWRMFSWAGNHQTKARGGQVTLGS
jgi:hypothetical protein